MLGMEPSAATRPSREHVPTFARSSRPAHPAAARFVDGLEARLTDCGR
jgi:hypothetical protein